MKKNKLELWTKASKMWIPEELEIKYINWANEVAKYLTKQIVYDDTYELKQKCRLTYVSN